MNLKFDHDFQQKIMIQQFTEPFELATAKDVQTWRERWMQELKLWHSPYKLIVDCSKLTVQPTPEVQEAVARMFKFFDGLFLKSTVGYITNSPTNLASHGLSSLPFSMALSFEEAQKMAGVKGARDPAAPVDFRASIQFQNHFAQHVIEMSFSDKVHIGSQDQIDAIKSKLTNNLMQWHSKWSLLIDCSKVTFSPDVKPAWTKLEGYFRGFFMKLDLGYSPKDENRNNYPFSTFRARHNAVARLENEGAFMGNEAHCRSKSSE